jgi:ECF transporter S component (folate family)
MQKKQIELRTLIILAMFAAIGAVFKAFVSVDLFFGGLKISDISLMALPVMLAGIYFGPLAGGMVGLLAEMGGFLMTPTGTYNPIFSLIAALTGVIAGVFYWKSKRTTLLKVVAMVALSEILCSAVLTTLTIHLIYGAPFLALIPARGIGVLIKIPVLTAMIVMLAERLRPVMQQQNKVPGTV